MTSRLARLVEAARHVKAKQCARRAHTADVPATGFRQRCPMPCPATRKRRIEP